MLLPVPIYITVDWCSVTVGERCSNLTIVVARKPIDQMWVLLCWASCLLLPQLSGSSLEWVAEAETEFLSAVYGRQAVEAAVKASSRKFSAKNYSKWRVVMEIFVKWICLVCCDEYQKDEKRMKININIVASMKSKVTGRHCLSEADLEWNIDISGPGKNVCIIVWRELWMLFISERVTCREGEFERWWSGRRLYPKSILRMRVGWRGKWDRYDALRSQKCNE